MIVVLPQVATAQDARAEARQHFNRGVAAVEDENWTGALQAFQEAYRLAPHPSVRLNIAACYEELDRPMEALFHYERFLLESEDVPAAQRREIQASVRRLEQRVGTVSLRVLPEGALVRLDQTEIRRAPILDSIRIAPGPHLVEVRLDGFVSQRREFIAEAGQQTEIAIRLEEGQDPVAETGTGTGTGTGEGSGTGTGTGTGTGEGSVGSPGTELEFAL